MSTELGTALTSSATKVLMLGSGELGKEVTIEFQRLGVEVIAVDRYENAPAMQVAHRSYTANMLDAAAIRKSIEAEKPDYIVPEIEAIATSELLKLEEEGWNVIPNARATYLTMNREGIRRLAAEELGLPTSKYRFASTVEEYKEAMAGIFTTSVGFATLDESPMAYKPMAEILDAITPTVDVLTVIRPVYNFKASDA